MARIRITHFSDALCIWAYLAQARVDQLRRDFPDDIELDYRYFQVFGSVNRKLSTQWADRGSLQGYAAHVQEIAASFDHVEVHPDAWIRATPASSMPAHLFLCAIRVMAKNDNQSDLPRKAAWAVREAFFKEQIDISNRHRLLELAESIDVSAAEVEILLNGGAAHAQLSADLELARDAGVKASPTMTFNEGRQQLTGNVGYRVMEANIRELLRAPTGQQSWC